jgi:hypothetical protein
MDTDKNYVLVEVVQQFRIRYAIKVPPGEDKSEYALNLVADNEPKEFSQKDLGETVISHRYMTEKGILELCDRDNDYCKPWPDSQKIKIFVTDIPEN